MWRASVDARKGPWLVVMLALLVTLGHACELPVSAVAELIPHVHGSAHGAADHHSGEPTEVACDAISAIPSSTAGVLDESHARDAAGVPPIPNLVGAGPVVAFVPVDPAPGSDSPPLFLRHRSLLI